MLLNNIQLHNFRSYSEATFDFSSTINIISGPNGIGKTTLLEAINNLSLARSFRTNNYRHLIKSGENEYLVHGTAYEDRPMTIQVACNTKGERRLYLDDTRLASIKELIGHFPCVVLLPEDLALVQEGNSGRRSLIDRILSITDPRYLDGLLKYRHIIRQRNQSLKQNLNDPAEITRWNPVPAETAALIWARRAEFFLEYEQHFQKIWAGFGLGEEATLIYKADVAPENRQTSYLQLLENNLASDIKARRTTRGPHGDKIMCLLNGFEIRNFSSLGEQKLFVSTLKLSEASYIHQNLGMAPVLLLDDLFSTLDQERANMLLDQLAKQYQTIISTTHLARENLKYLATGEVNAIVLPEI